GWLMAVGGWLSTVNCPLFSIHQILMFKKQMILTLTITIANKSDYMFMLNKFCSEKLDSKKYFELKN
ncbi:MAG: hypothetical protein VKN72_03390, partial [Nostocales cyanobacterium 94392]|nr:hypothetical protein [Nostocales cyanobacterium 94392]